MEDFNLDTNSLDAGSLLAYNEFSDIVLFVRLLATVFPNSHLDYLLSVLDKQDLIKFVDVFQGVSLKIPTRKSIKKYLDFIIVYRYCQKEDFSEGIKKDASIKFHKRVSTINNIITTLKALDI